jgi:hypothetical protein
MTEGRREDRFDVDLQGRYRTGSGIARDVVVSDLSTRGCKFFDKHCNIDVGAAISIKVGSIGPLTARVRWVTGQTVGVEFDSKLHESVLDHMRTTMRDWAPQEAPPPPPPPSLPKQRKEKPKEPAEETVSLTIRAVSPEDVRTAIARAQMELPLRTEAEVISVFYRIMEKVRTD